MTAGFMLTRSSQTDTLTLAETDEFSTCPLERRQNVAYNSAYIVLPPFQGHVSRLITGKYTKPRILTGPDPDPAADPAIPPEKDASRAVARQLLFHRVAAEQFLLSAHFPQPSMLTRVARIPHEDPAAIARRSHRRGEAGPSG